MRSGASARLCGRLRGRKRRLAVDEASQGQLIESEILVDRGFGQLLDIVAGPDGFIYFSSTSAIHRLRP